MHRKIGQTRRRMNLGRWRILIGWNRKNPHRSSMIDRAGWWSVRGVASIQIGKSGFFHIRGVIPRKPKNSDFFRIPGNWVEKISQNWVQGIWLFRIRHFAAPIWRWNPIPTPNWAWDVLGTPPIRLVQVKIFAWPPGAILSHSPRIFVGKFQIFESSDWSDFGVAGDKRKWRTRARPWNGSGVPRLTPVQFEGPQKSPDWNKEIILNIFISCYSPNSAPRPVDFHKILSLVIGFFRVKYRGDYKVNGIFWKNKIMCIGQKIPYLLL